MRWGTEYVAMRLNGKGHIIEILGLKGSSPAEERHRGFADALRDTEIKILATLQGDWTEEKGYEAIKQYEGNLKDIDLVFAHNDRSALGARRAFIEAKISQAKKAASSLCAILCWKPRISIPHEATNYYNWRSTS